MASKDVLLGICAVLSVAVFNCHAFQLHSRVTSDEESSDGMDVPLMMNDEAELEDAQVVVKFCLEIAPAVMKIFQQAFNMWHEGKEADLEREACCQFYRNQTCFKDTVDPFFYGKTLEECQDFSVTKHCSMASSLTLSCWIFVTSLSFAVLLTKYHT